MEMQYAEARSYCHMLLLCRKGIQKSIDIFHKKQLKQQTEMLKKVYTTFDPEGDRLTKMDRMEIPFVKVRWGKQDDTFMLERPQAWIKTFVQALIIYKSIVGDVKYAWIIYLYSRGHDVGTVATHYNVTRTTIYKEIDRLKTILVLVAVQNRLITIVKNQAPELDEEGRE